MSVEARKNLQEAVRSWVHYDNLYTAHQQQAQNARVQKNKYEKSIDEALKSLKSETAILEINGAKLQFQKKESKSALTWSWLNEHLRSWIKAQNLPEQKNEDLITFLQTKRTVKIATSLEKLT